MPLAYRLHLQFNCICKTSHVSPLLEHMWSCSLICWSSSFPALSLAFAIKLHFQNLTCQSSFRAHVISHVSPLLEPMIEASHVSTLLEPMIGTDTLYLSSLFRFSTVQCNLINCFCFLYISHAYTYLLVHMLRYGNKLCL